MSIWLALRSTLLLLASLKSVKCPLKRLVLLWQYLKRLLWRRRVVRDDERRDGTSKGTSAGSVVRKPSTVSRSIHSDDVVTICASRRPLSALELHLDHPHGQFLQPGDTPTRPSSMIVSGHSPVQSSADMLSPYSYAHSNESRTSSISFGIHSTSRGRHLEVARPRPDPRPTSRADARGIMRVASKAPSRASCSRSRSRAQSRTPARSEVDLPIVSGPSTASASASKHTLALPSGEAARPTSETIPSISLPVHEEDIYPILANPRYDNYTTIAPGGTLDITPVMLQFPLEGIPSGWTAHTHPEGRLYFHHPLEHIYTDCDIRDPTIYEIIQEFKLQIQEKIQCQELELPPQHDLVLCLEERQISGGFNRIYYFADHTTRALFWIQECDSYADLDVDEISTLNKPYDIRLELQARYWSHIEMYPYGHRIPDDVFTDLNSILLFSSMDVVTSLTTTVHYRPDEVHRMIAIVKSAKALEETDHATAVIGRLMSIWLHHHWINFHGQTYARLGRDQSVYTTSKAHRTALIKILAPLFWNAPYVHLRGLERMWIDGLITMVPWGGFIAKLQNEWQEFVLYSTVLLNANVAFLAIPSVDTGNGQITPAQVCSYLSIVTSVGSIVLGLLLIRQHRVKAKETAEEARTYLKAQKHERLGLETLATIYSLPYALLMWGMVTFLLAFAFEWFSTHNKPSIFITAAGCILIAILVCWTIITGWETGERSGWLNAKQFVSHFWAHVLPSHHEEGSANESTSHEIRSNDLDESDDKIPQKLWARVRSSNVFPHFKDKPMSNSNA